ncbi:hypothetical protein PILCRDRAFT_93380 [Piloderma croceum F 1598]|uniref:Uncharacterized protein n=1 Tax=Piloderma croceum (strain F 1598) TaxID=765440 RepID=A0A0C3AFS8_PILCF|nr:hypothetical protein PILCRDRAFT_93380 [Piloderma croceum F 1598]
MWRYVGRYEMDANILVATTPVGNWDHGLDLEVAFGLACEKLLGGILPGPDIKEGLSEILTVASWAQTWEGTKESGAELDTVTLLNVRVLVIILVPLNTSFVPTALQKQGPFKGRFNAKDLIATCYMLASGVGLIVGANFDKLNKEVHKVKDWTREIMDKSKSEEILSFMNATYATMIHCWVRLAHSPGMFKEKCLEVSEVQQAWLKHWAVMDYYKKRQHMMETQTEPPSGPIKETVGLAHQGLPHAAGRYSLRRQTGGIRKGGVMLGVGKEAGCRLPCGVQQQMGPQSSLYQAASVHALTVGVEEPMGGWGGYLEGWGYGAHVSDKEFEGFGGSPNKSGQEWLEKEGSSIHSKRIWDFKGGCTSRDKFAELKHNPLSPPGIPAWVERLKNVKHLAPGDAGEKQKTKAPPTLISPSLWRECLFYGLATGQSTLLPANGKQFKKVKKMAEAFMLDLDDKGNLVIPCAKQFPLTGKDTRLMCRGRQLAKKEDGSLDDEVVREMLWELYELSFRLELRALDRGLSMTQSLEDIDEWEEMVKRCFAGGDGLGFELTLPVIPVSNAGLASNDLQERGPYIMALARLMTVGKPKAIEELAFVQELSSDKLAKLESAVATLYCRAFYDYHTRAPLTPHCIK